MAKKRKRSQKQLLRQAQNIVQRITKKWSALEAKGYISYQQYAWLESSKSSWLNKPKQTRQINLNIPEHITTRDIQRLQKAERNIKWYFKGGYITNPKTGEAVFYETRYYENKLKQAQFVKRSEAAKRGWETRRKREQIKTEATEALEQAYAESEEYGKTHEDEEISYPQFEKVEEDEWTPFDTPALTTKIAENMAERLKGALIAEGYVDDLNNPIYFNWKDSSGLQEWYTRRQSVLNRLLAYLNEVIATVNKTVLNRIEKNADRLNTLIENITQMYQEDAGEMDAVEFLRICDYPDASDGDVFYAGY